VGRKIALGFAVVVLIISVVSVNRFDVASSTQETFEKISDDVLLEWIALGQIRALGTALLGETREYLLFGEASTLEEIQETKEELETALDSYAGVGQESKERTEEEELAITNRLQTAITAVEARSDTLIALYKAVAGEQEIKAAGEELKTAEQALGVAVEAAEARLNVELEAGKAAMSATTNRTLLMTAAGPFIMLFLVLGITYLLSRAITRPVKHLAQAALRIAAGDLEQEVDITSEDEIGVLAQSFNQMTAQLRGLVQSLAQRTRELDRLAGYLLATANMARDVSSELELEKLLPRIVNLVSEQFGFYHCGLFLLEADIVGQWAVLRAASSRDGQRLLARGHRLSVEASGIVSAVARHGEYHVALDTDQDATFLDNTDLPGTRSEIALPLKVLGKTIGVLDVHSQDAQAFSPNDVMVLQTLADQVSVAISNAHLFQQMQESLEAEQRAYGELTHEAWVELLRKQPDLGFVKEQGTISPIGDLWEPQMVAALQTGETTPDQDKEASIAVPIKVRDRVIGVIDADSPGGLGQWTPEQIVLLETLAEQLGLALESARLYQDTQRRAAHDRLVSEISEQVRGSLDPDTILKTTVRELGRALGAKLAAVEISAPKKNGDGFPAQERE
jgi:GAF domain-containing protein/HAMP domain-containing protein